MKLTIIFLIIQLNVITVKSQCNEYFSNEKENYYLFSLNSMSCYKYRGEIIDCLKHAEKQGISIKLLIGEMSLEEANYFIKNQLLFDTNTIPLMQNKNLANCLLTGGFDIFRIVKNGSLEYLTSEEFLTMENSLKMHFIPIDTIVLNADIVPLNEREEYFLLDENSLLAHNPALNNLTIFRLSDGKQVLEVTKRPWSLSVLDAVQIKSDFLFNSAEVYDSMIKMGIEPIAVNKVFKYSDNLFYALINCIYPIAFDPIENHLTLANRQGIIEFSKELQLVDILLFSNESLENIGKPNNFLARLSNGKYITLYADKDSIECADDKNTCLVFNEFYQNGNDLIFNKQTTLAVPLFFKTKTDELFLHALIPAYYNGNSYAVYKYAPIIKAFNDSMTIRITCDTTYLSNIRAKHLGEVKSAYTSYFINHFLFYQNYAVFAIGLRTFEKNQSFKVCLSKLNENCYSCTTISDPIFLNSIQFISNDIYYVIKNGVIYKFGISLEYN